MHNTIFITGTDTDIGKTYVSCQLCKEFNNLDFKTAAFKAIASGCFSGQDGELYNDDALALLEHSSIKIPYSKAKPISLPQPIAPHIAAKINNIKLSKEVLINKINSLLQSEADINIIEGVGGWAVPLNNNQLISDTIISQNIAVVLVVGLKLGCINHALLTYQQMLTQKANIVGWIGNCVDPNMLALDDNIATIKNWIKSPCLGIVPYNCNNTGHINIKPLIT